MTDEEMKRLEDAAKAATPGPWEYNGHRIQAVEPVPVDWADEPQKPSVIWDPFCFEHPDVDRPYVVAANPAAVLALIERVRKAERKGAEKAAELVASLPKRPGMLNMPVAWRAAIIDAETWIRTLLVEPP